MIRTEILTKREAQSLGDLIVRIAVIPLLAAALLLASPGAAFAQSVGGDQYTNADPGHQQGEYTNADAGQQQGEYTNADSEQQQSDDSGQRQGEYTNAVPSQDQDGGNQQVPVGPGDPANPDSTPQAPETFEQSLTGILTDLNSISQSLTALSQQTAPAAAQDSNAALTAPTAPANVIAGGTGTVPVPVSSAPITVVPTYSSGQPPVVQLNPYSTAVNAASSNVMLTGGVEPANTRVMLTGGVEPANTRVALTGGSGIYPSVQTDPGPLLGVLDRLAAQTGTAAWGDLSTDGYKYDTNEFDHGELKILNQERPGSSLPYDGR